MKKSDFCALASSVFLVGSGCANNMAIAWVFLIMCVIYFVLYILALMDE